MVSLEGDVVEGDVGDRLRAGWSGYELGER